MEDRRCAGYPPSDCWPSEGPLPPPVDVDPELRSTQKIPPHAPLDAPPSSRFNLAPSARSCRKDANQEDEDNEDNEDNEDDEDDDGRDHPPGIPPAPADCRYAPPARSVLCAADIPAWLHSEAFLRVMHFILAVNSAIVGRRCSDASAPPLVNPTTASIPSRPTPQHPAIIVSMISALEKLLAIADLIPANSAHNQNCHARYGNPLFRDFADRLALECLSIHMDIIPENCPLLPSNCCRDLLIQELMPYFLCAFGNPQRLDYGSGHELSFVCWLACFQVSGLFAPTTAAPTIPCAVDQLSAVPPICNSNVKSPPSAIVSHEDILRLVGLVVFPMYLKVVRKLQRQYRLEPAGSHGVWGLDDYQFIPYLWGAAQLQGRKDITPNNSIKLEIASHFASDYMYLAAIEEIYLNKTGPFYQHSSMLYDISGVPNWEKVNSGMIKMYLGDIISKYPVVQHLYFGQLLPWRPYDNSVA